MKKFIALFFALLLILSLCACGNENLGWGNYTYKHVTLVGSDTPRCLTVESWHDNELGCEIKTKEVGSIYCSEGTYILIEDATNCPFCGG